MSLFIHLLAFFLESFSLWAITLTTFRRSVKTYWKKLFVASLIALVIDFVFSDTLHMNYLYLVLYSIPIYPIVHRLILVRESWSIAWVESLVGIAVFRMIQLTVVALVKEFDLTTYSELKHNLFHLIIFRTLIPLMAVLLFQLWMIRKNAGFHLTRKSNKTAQHLLFIFNIIYLSAIITSFDVWKDVVLNDHFNFLKAWHGYTIFIVLIAGALCFIWTVNKRAWKRYYKHMRSSDFENRASLFK